MNSFFCCNSECPHSVKPLTQVLKEEVQIIRTSSAKLVVEIQLRCPHCNTLVFICDCCAQLLDAHREERMIFCDVCGLCNIRDKCLKEHLFGKSHHVIKKIISVQLRINETNYVSSKISEYEELLAEINQRTSQSTIPKEIDTKTRPVNAFPSPPPLPTTKTTVPSSTVLETNTLSHSDGNDSKETSTIKIKTGKKNMGSESHTRMTAECVPIRPASSADLDILRTKMKIIKEELELIGKRKSNENSGADWSPQSLDEQLLDFLDGYIFSNTHLNILKCLYLNEMPRHNMPENLCKNHFPSSYDYNSKNGISPKIFDKISVFLENKDRLITLKKSFHFSQLTLQGLCLGDPNQYPMIDVAMDLLHSQTHTKRIQWERESEPFIKLLQDLNEEFTILINQFEAQLKKLGLYKTTVSFHDIEAVFQDEQNLPDENLTEFQENQSNAEYPTNSDDAKVSETMNSRRLESVQVPSQEKMTNSNRFNNVPHLNEQPFEDFLFQDDRSTKSPSEKSDIPYDILILIRQKFLLLQKCYTSIASVVF